MSLFAYKTNENQINSAFNINSSNPEFRTNIIRASCFKNSGFKVDEVEVPLGAAIRFAEAVMSAGRQLQVLDLTDEGAEKMRKAYEAGDTSFGEFLEDYIPSL